MLKIFTKTLISIFSIFFVFIIIFFVGVLWPFDETKPVVTNAPIVIKNISIIDLESGEIIDKQTILVESNKIISVAPLEKIDIPNNAIEIDGRNRFAMPSLWDMHTHVFKITPLLDLPLYIANGVTNVRDMTSCPKKGDPFVPCPDLKRWSQAAADNELVAPRIQGTTSWHINGPSIHKKIKGIPEFFGTSTPEEARQFARYYAGKVDALKIYNYVPRDSYFALVEEAKKLNLDVVGHRPHAVSAIEAAQHQKSIEHARFILHESFSGSEQLRVSASIKGAWKEDRRKMLDEHSPHKANNIFAAMKTYGTWYVPTHLTRREDAYADDARLLNDPNLRFLHPLIKWQWMEDLNKIISRNPSEGARQTYREFYQKGLELTGAAHKAGVKILVGTDHVVAGVNVHDELKQLVLAGLSPLDALRAATISPVEYFGLEKKYGRIAKGFSADFILLNNNPLEDISHSSSIESVIFNGNLYDRRQLDDIEKQVELRAKSWTIACKILWMYLKHPVNY